MSNKTFNARNNKAKKGISPVIATVILVAVAVVIAAALAGFSSSLFGTYSSAGAAVTVKSISVKTDGSGAVTLVNSGNIADELVSVQALPNAPHPLTSPDGKIAPNSELPITLATGDLGASFDNGQMITVKLTMKSGLALTQSVVVTN
jgi:flagellin-like protein